MFSLLIIQIQGIKKSRSTHNTSGLNYYYCNYDLKSFSNKLLTDFSATIKTYNILLN